MSADLLAEFGQDSRPPQSSAGNPQTARSQTNSAVPNPAPDDDDFFSSLSRPNLHSSQFATNPTPSINQSPAPKSQHPPGFEFFNLPRHDNSDVLFDAETDTPANDADDDWGDFEGPAATSNNEQRQSIPGINRAQPPPAHHQASQLNLLDSLSLHDSAEPPSHITHKPISNHVSSSTPAAPVSHLVPPESTWDDDSFGDWGEFTNTTPTNPPPTQLQTAPKSAAKSTPKPTPKPTLKAKPNTKKPTASRKITTAPKEPEWDDEFEDWGDFSDGPAPKAPQQATSKPKPSTPSPLSFTSSTPTSPPTVRPTNIPPPSVLLSLLIDIINKLKEDALQARSSPSTKEETVLRIQTTLATAARIIAGRTLRWKRDSILSQSMRIGPARKQGGMKLNTVNKHEDVKESQDAVEVLSLWRERSAIFNSVVQSVGQKPVPVVADPAVLKVITARVDEGAIKASHACALCALKRDERVLRIDEGDVNDSFGEWWTEHWGHTGCRIFWEKNKELLLQR